MNSAVLLATPAALKVLPATLLITPTVLPLLMAAARSSACSAKKPPDETVSITSEANPATEVASETIFFSSSPVGSAKATGLLSG